MNENEIKTDQVKDIKISLTENQMKDIPSKKKIYTKTQIELAQKRMTTNTYAYYMISFYAGVSTITELAVSFYFKDILKIQPAEMSRISSLISLPWSFKPLLGLLTDFCPILGYKRKYYIVLCGLIAMLCWFNMATTITTVWSAMTYLFLINVANSFSSVLGEAIVVELARDRTLITGGEDAENDEEQVQDPNASRQSRETKEISNRAKDFVSIWMIFKYSGVLFSSFMKGSLVEEIGIKGVFSIGIFLPLLVVIAGVIMVDIKVGTKKKTDYHHISETGHIDVEPIETPIEHEEEEPISIKEMLIYLCKTEILLPIVFIILFMATPSYSDPFFYFLTNDLKFSPTALGKISFCSTIAVLIGIFAYKKYFKNAKFRSIITGGTILSFLFSFAGYALVERWNKRVGVNDFWLVLLSNSLLSMIGEVMLLPLLSIACVLCPKNMEGTIFSVFMSALNFGGVLSNLSGSVLTSYLGITSTNYSNLSCLILISNIMTLFPLPLLYCIDEKYFKS